MTDSEQFSAWQQEARSLRKNLEEFRNQESNEESRRDLSIAITHMEDAEMRVGHLITRKDRVGASSR